MKNLNLSCSVYWKIDNLRKANIVSLFLKYDGDGQIENIISQSIAFEKNYSVKLSVWRYWLMRHTFGTFKIYVGL